MAMHASSVLFTISYVALAVVQLVLLVQAFRTSLKLGLMTLFVPMYAVSVGNHRLKTEHRRALAAAWWIALGALIISVVAFS